MDLEERRRVTISSASSDPMLREGFWQAMFPRLIENRAESRVWREESPAYEAERLLRRVVEKHRNDPTTWASLIHQWLNTRPNPAHMFSWIELTIIDWLFSRTASPTTKNHLRHLLDLLNPPK